MATPVTEIRMHEGNLGFEALRSDAAQPMHPVERVRRLAGLERADIAVVVVYSGAIGLVSLAVPVATQALVNTVAFTVLVQPLVVLSLLVFLGLAVAGVLRVLQHRVIEVLQQRLFVRAAHDAVRRLVRADIRAFREHGAPELMNRFFDIANVQKAASTLLMDGLAVVLQGTVSLVLLAFYHPALLAFDVLLIILIAVTIFGLGRNGVATAIKESKAKYQTAAWIEDMAGAMRTFKAKGADEFALAKADELAREYVLARRKHFKVLIRQVVASYVLQAIATATLLGLGGWLVIQGELTLGQLVAAELVVTGVLSGVSKFGKYLENYYDLVASVDKIGVIVDIPAEREGGAPTVHREPGAHLALSGVSYVYDGQVAALSDVSLEIQAGQSIAIFGGDASGKSTMVDLLYGLRVPTQGQLRIDGIDLRTLALADLREDIALASQAEVFDGTVVDNIRMGRERVDAACVAEVLDMVSLSPEIANLPQGAATRLGHSGSRLTSSQAARLTIARALAQRPRLLIIDEALDGLDVDTARKVLQNVAESTRHHTSVVVFTSSQEVAAAVGQWFRLDRGMLKTAGGVS